MRGTDISLGAVNQDTRKVTAELKTHSETKIYNRNLQIESLSHLPRKGETTN
jgi:hypothetical protein